MSARFLPPAALERAAFGATGLAALSFAYERVDPSVGLTPDLRLTNLSSAIALALGLWVLACVRSKRWPRVPVGVALPLLVWLGVVTVSALAAPSHQTEALAFTGDLVLGVLLGWAAYDLTSLAPRRLWLVRSVAISGAGVGVLGLAEAARIAPIAGWLQGFKYQSFRLAELERVSATLPHPNIAAMVLGLTLPLLMVWGISSQHAWARFVLGLALLAGFATLVLTLSRSGVVALMLSLGLMAGIGLWQQQRRVLRAALFALGGLVLIVVAAVVAKPVLLLHLRGESADSWYVATYEPPATMTALPGESTSVPVRVENTGVRTWEAAGPHPFVLSYHVLGIEGTPVTYDGLRTGLPRDVPPGSAVEVDARLAAPPVEGDYLVEWDEVHESATWFSWTGTPTGRTRLTVAGAPVPALDWRVTPPPDSTHLLRTPGRLQLWRIALHMARNRPLLGVGPDNFRWVYGDFAQVAHWDTGVHANNLYLEWLADTGILGLAAFGWFTWRLARAVVQPVFWERSGRTPIWVWQLALVAALVGWYAHGMADYFYAPLTTNVGFWLIVGLALSSAEDLGGTPARIV